MELNVRDRASRVSIVLPVLAASICTLVVTQVLLGPHAGDTFVGEATSNALAIAFILPWLALLLRLAPSRPRASEESAHGKITRSMTYMILLIASTTAVAAIGETQPQLRDSLPSIGEWPLVIAAFAGQVAAEELLFRIILPVVLSVAFTGRKDSFFWGVVLANLAFAWWHIPASLPAFIDHFAFGLLMAFIYSRTRSLLTLWIVHAGNNYFILLIDAPLTGGTDAVTLLIVLKYAILFWLAQAIFPSLNDGDSRYGNPYSFHERIRGIDLLRGAALVMIVIENSLFYAEAEWATADTSWMDQLARGTLALLVEYRGLPIFCILLGFTTQLMLTRNACGRRRVSTRATGFLALGAIHGIFFFPGDILAIFGLALFVVLWLVRRTATTRMVVTWIAAFGFVGQAAFASWGITLSTNFDDISAGMANFPDAALARSIEWLAYLLTFPLHASAVLFPLLIGFSTWTKLTEGPMASRSVVIWGAGLVLLSVLLCLPNALFLGSEWGEARSGFATFAAQIGGLLGALGAWILVAGFFRTRDMRGISESRGLSSLLEIMGQRTLSLYLASSVVYFVALSLNGLNLMEHGPLWAVWVLALLCLTAYALYVRAGRSPVGWAENAHGQFSRSFSRRQHKQEWNQAAGDSSAAWIHE